MTVALAKLGSPEMLGQFALGLAITAPIFMFAALRLREVQATDIKQVHLFRDYFALRVTTSTVALLTVVGVVSFTGFQRELGLVVLAVAAGKAVESISDAFYGLFTQYEQMDLTAKSMMLQGPLTLAGLCVGVYFTESIFWGVIGLAVARVSVLLCYDIPKAFFLLNPGSQLTKFLVPRRLHLPRLNLVAVAKLAWLALPLGFVTMLIAFRASIPRFFIHEHLGMYQLGLFAAVASFQKADATIVMALGRSATPRLAHHYSKCNFKAYRKLLLKLTGISILLGATGILVAYVAGREILTLFYGAEYALHWLFVWLMIASAIDHTATVFHFGMTSARYFRVQLPVFLLTTSAAGIASFILIPTAGLHGAGIALVIAALVRAGGSLVALWHAERKLHHAIASDTRASAY